MTIRRQLSTLSLAVAAALPLALPLAWPTAAVAQPFTQTRVEPIVSFGVAQVQRLRPGNTLDFSLAGVPGAQVNLQLEGATAGVAMAEVQPGQYRGTYTIRARDRLSAASVVTATLIHRGQTSTALLSQSLVQGAPPPQAAATVPAQINEFTARAPERPRPGDELGFTLRATPGGAARVVVQGLERPVPLNEVRPGVYEGSHVLRRNERVRGELQADAYLLRDRREVSRRYDPAFVPPPPYEAVRGDGRPDGRLDGRPDGRPQPGQVACAQCGRIEAINLVEVKSDSPNIIGTIAGGVLGGVVGRQVGGGTGRDIATVIGAVGGAYAGNRIESNANKTKVYRLTVRLDGGTTQDFDYAQDPSVDVGTRVRVDNGVLVRL